MKSVDEMLKRWKELASQPKTEEEKEEAETLKKLLTSEFLKEYSGFINELSNIGININSVWDLVNTRQKYKEAIPLLLEYLPKVKYDRNKEGFIRALTVPEAKGIAVQPLLHEYFNTPNENQDLRWVIGNAINTVITKHEVHEIFPIVLNEENGFSRDMFVRALGRIKTPEVKAVLLVLINDPNEEIRAEAIKALKKHR